MDVERLARDAKAASRTVAQASRGAKDAALLAMAQAVRRAASDILAVNRQETAAAAAAGKTAAFVDRLKLDAGRVEVIAGALEHVASLSDPVGRITDFAVRPNGLRIRKMRVPLGVIAIIYESRPGVTADAAGLCLKSGNACLLRGGKEAMLSNAAIVAALREGLAKGGLPQAAIGFVDDADRAIVSRLLQLDQEIDLVIPRGGPELTRAVRRESVIPVLAHDKGVCHTFVDDSADLAMAEAICLNAKAQRPGVCNAMETLLVHEGIAKRFLPVMGKRYLSAGVELRGCAETRALLPTAKPAVDADWDTEYLGLVLSVKIVASLEEAISHIARHGTGLAEAIVTQNASAAARFQREVDSGAVFVNASTRFTDGSEFGLGAEMGISTQKIHARGPIGLEGLTCEKFVIEGTGQTRTS